MAERGRPLGNPDFTIRFWGVRGSIPCPGPETVRYGGNTACVEIRCGNHLLIFDGGSGLRALGIDIAPFWDPRVYAEHRDGDISAWIGHRLAFATHPRERHTIERRLRALSLRHVMPAISAVGGA